MKDAEQSRDASSGQRERAAEQTYAEPSRTQTRECRQWESVGLPRGQRWSHNRTRKQRWKRERGWPSRARESESNKRTNDTKAMNTPTTERTNECGERTNAVHWVEASPQSQWQSQSVCVPDSVAEWESLSLSPRRVATMNAIVSGCRWPLSLPTPTSPRPQRCPLTPCAAAVTLHFYFASLHRSTQYALGTKPMAWTGSASAPVSASDTASSLASASSSAMPLAELCLWRALH